MSERAAEEPVERTARLLRKQSEACAEMGSPLYATLLENAADDLLGGGPTRQVLEGHFEDPGASALALRMMGGVHALVLTGKAPDLARFYPSASGSVVDPAHGAWPAFATALEANRDEARRWLLRPPQTNEVGRGAALIGGLLHIAAEAPRPLRLVEIGASGGLNLRADRFRIDGEVATFGDASSPVQLGAAWRGVAPPSTPVEIVERYAGDLDPVDVMTAEGQLLLAAYVWPDQVARLERLRGAFELAARLPVELRRESALETLARTSLADDTWTVLWHSVFQQYLSREDRAALDAGISDLGESADTSRRFAHLKLEPEPDRNYAFLVTLTTWPGGEARILGTASGHGLPTTWER